MGDDRINKLLQEIEATQKELEKGEVNTNCKKTRYKFKIRDIIDGVSDAINKFKDYEPKLGSSRVYNGFIVRITKIKTLINGKDRVKIEIEMRGKLKERTAYLLGYMLVRNGQMKGEIDAVKHDDKYFTVEYIGEKTLIRYIKDI